MKLLVGVCLHVNVLRYSSKRGNVEPRTVIHISCNLEPEDFQFDTATDSKVREPWCSFYGASRTAPGFARIWLTRSSDSCHQIPVSPLKGLTCFIFTPVIYMREHSSFLHRCPSSTPGLLHLRSATRQQKQFRWPRRFIHFCLPS